MENIFTVVKFNRDYTSLSVQYVLFNTTDDRNEIKYKNVYYLNYLNYAHGKTYVSQLSSVVKIPLEDILN